MTPHPSFALFQVAFILIMVLSGWNLWRIRRVHRARGRQAVDSLLANRGETLVALRELKVSALPTITGLSSTVAFEVTARSRDGAEHTYQWAYEPRVFPWQTEGLKRLAHGIWIPA
jgi:hypothetical protein